MASKWCSAGRSYLLGGAVKPTEFKNYRQSSLVKHAHKNVSSQYDMVRPCPYYSDDEHSPAKGRPESSTQPKAVELAASVIPEVAPKEPEALDTEILVKAEMLMCSVSSLELGEVEEAMEVTPPPTGSTL